MGLGFFIAGLIWLKVHALLLLSVIAGSLVFKIIAAVALAITLALSVVAIGFLLYKGYRFLKNYVVNKRETAPISTDVPDLVKPDIEAELKSLPELETLPELTPTETLEEPISSLEDKPMVVESFKAPEILSGSKTMKRNWKPHLPSIPEINLPEINFPKVNFKKPHIHIPNLNLFEKASNATESMLRGKNRIDKAAQEELLAAQTLAANLRRRIPKSSASPMPVDPSPPDFISPPLLVPVGPQRPVISQKVTLPSRSIAPKAPQAEVIYPIQPRNLMPLSFDASPPSMLVVSLMPVVPPKVIGSARDIEPKALQAEVIYPIQLRNLTPLSFDESSSPMPVMPPEPVMPVAYPVNANQPQNQDQVGLAAASVIASVVQARAAQSEQSTSDAQSDMTYPSKTQTQPIELGEESLRAEKEQADEAARKRDQDQKASQEAAAQKAQEQEANEKAEQDRIVVETQRAHAVAAEAKKLEESQERTQAIEPEAAKVIDEVRQRVEQEKVLQRIKEAEHQKRAKLEEDLRNVRNRAKVSAAEKVSIALEGLPNVQDSSEQNVDYTGKVNKLVNDSTILSEQAVEQAKQKAQELSTAVEAVATQKTKEAQDYALAQKEEAARLEAAQKLAEQARQKAEAQAEIEKQELARKLEQEAQEVIKLKEAEEFTKAQAIELEEKRLAQEARQKLEKEEALQRTKQEMEKNKKVQQDQELSDLRKRIVTAAVEKVNAASKGLEQVKGSSEQNVDTAEGNKLVNEPTVLYDKAVEQAKQKAQKSYKTAKAVAKQKLQDAKDRALSEKQAKQALEEAQRAKAEEEEARKLQEAQERAKIEAEKAKIEIAKKEEARLASEKTAQERRAEILKRLWEQNANIPVNSDLQVKKSLDEMVSAREAAVQADKVAQEAQKDVKAMEEAAQEAQTKADEAQQDAQKASQVAIQAIIDRHEQRGPKVKPPRKPRMRDTKLFEQEKMRQAQEALDRFDQFQTARKEAVENTKANAKAQKAQVNRSQARDVPPVVIHTPSTPSIPLLGSVKPSVAPAAAQAIHYRNRTGKALKNIVTGLGRPKKP